ncbi:MAG: substrate-binding domain-containing protein [Sphingomonas fennica]
MNLARLPLLSLIALALAGCGGDGARRQIRAVGSSTVYPFTTAVAEQFARRRPGMQAPIVEATGTGAGIKLFCAGVGSAYPDIVNASRRIKPAELADCRRNGIARIVELRIGIDGLILARGATAPATGLTERQVYAALAAEPFGRPQRARTWADVDPALPAVPILVYGPPPSSGTRDALAELILDKGCDSDPAMAALKARDAKRHTRLCTHLREDGAYVETGENDNLIVQKLAANPRAIGIFGYSFLEENEGRVRPVPIQGIAPDPATIADGRYPGARPLYVYVKAAHLDAIPALRPFIADYAESWGPGGYLARRGLIPSPPAVAAANRAIARTMTPLDPASIS